MGAADLACRRIVGMRVDATSFADATERICAWAKEGRSSYVAVANVHMTMEAHDSPEFAKVVERADLVTPDGMPLVWALKALGVGGATRVNGPALTLHICEAAEREGLPIAMYGGTPESLADFCAFLGRRYPRLQIVCSIAPPFRPPTDEEDLADTDAIVSSGAKILFVGIGCPKQENWMSAHRGRIPAAMIGVGAAFDFHSGRVRQAPKLLQRAGLEWAFRLVMEPRRLFRRYALHNPRFIALAGAQLLRSRLSATRPRTS